MVRPPKVLDIQVRDHCYRLQPLDTFTLPPVPNTKAHFGCGARRRWETDDSIPTTWGSREGTGTMELGEAEPGSD